LVQLHIAPKTPKPPSINSVISVCSRISSLPLPLANVVQMPGTIG